MTMAVAAPINPAVVEINPENPRDAAKSVTTVKPAIIDNGRAKHPIL
tara:strand:- start:791 stop:931 length:141 start_codon:yes stop_codon:yes gene_type:complete